MKIFNLFTHFTYRQDGHLMITEGTEWSLRAMNAQTGWNYCKTLDVKDPAHTNIILTETPVSIK